ncbi:calcium-translocating P-type ATPase PMCA-type [Ruminococcus sp. CAG:382]|nr:calcium-translocating P-type ATPase PMCA-type [Ruminococcus sp. CAG:382]
MSRTDEFPKINTFTPETAKRAGDEELSYSEMYPHEVAEKFGSDITNGLDPKAVRRQRAKYGANIVSGQIGLSFKASLKKQYTNLLTVLLLFGSLLIFVFDRSPLLLLVPAGCIILTFANAILEHYAGKKLSELKRQTASGAAVIRGGKTMVTDSRSVVCGDVIYLEDGDIVPADARLIECNALTVLETPISGVSSAAAKDARFTEKKGLSRVSENMVYAGSIVTGGNGVAIVCEVGSNVRINKKSNHNPMSLPSVLRGTQKEGRIVTGAAAVFELVLIAVGIVRGVGLAEVFVLALGIGVIALTDTSFAFAAYTFADCLTKALKKGAAIRNFDCVPKLVGINSVMCDKQTAFPPTVIKADRLYDCFGEYRVDAGRSDGAVAVLRYMLLCSSVKEVMTGDKDKKALPLAEKYVGSTLSLSLMEAADKLKYSLEEAGKGFYRIESEFDSRGEMTRVLGLLDGSPVVIIKGVPENVISRCAGYRQNGTNYRFDDKSRRKVLAFAEEISKTRTPIAVAVGNTAADSLRDITVERKLVLIGIVGLYSTFEVGAASAVFKCRQAGIEIVVSSDDSYYTAYNTAKNAGIIENEHEICTAETLRTTEEGLFIANCPGYKIFTGLTDSEWLYIEQLRKQDGKRVAVSASRTEQLQLMKDADVSFAPKRGSTDTLLATCDVQMKNDGFDTITETLKSARMAMKRITNTAEYFVVGFMTMFFWALLSIIVSGKLPFSSGDVFLFGILINILISVSLAFAPPERNILAEPLPAVRPRDKLIYYALPALYSLIGGGLCLFSSQVTLRTAGNAPVTASLVTFSALLFFYSLMCGVKHSVFINRAYMNYLSFAMLAVVAAIIAAIIYIPKAAAFMGYAPLNGTQLLVAVGIAFIFFLAAQVVMLLVSRSQ